MRSARPSLRNVALTAPYGHAGAYADAAGLPARASAIRVAALRRLRPQRWRGCRNWTAPRDWDVLDDPERPRRSPPRSESAGRADARPRSTRSMPSSALTGDRALAGPARRAGNGAQRAAGASLRPAQRVGPELGTVAPAQALIGGSRVQSGPRRPARSPAPRPRSPCPRPKCSGTAWPPAWPPPTVTRGSLQSPARAP